MLANALMIAAGAFAVLAVLWQVAIVVIVRSVRFPVEPPRGEVIDIAAITLPLNVQADLDAARADILSNGFNELGWARTNMPGGFFVAWSALSDDRTTLASMATMCAFKKWIDAVNKRSLVIDFLSKSSVGAVAGTSNSADTTQDVSTDEHWLFLPRCARPGNLLLVHHAHADDTLGPERAVWPTDLAEILAELQEKQRLANRQLIGRGYKERKGTITVTWAKAAAMTLTAWRAANRGPIDLDERHAHHRARLESLGLSDLWD